MNLVARISASSLRAASSEGRVTVILLSNKALDATTAPSEGSGCLELIDSKLLGETCDSNLSTKKIKVLSLSGLRSLTLRMWTLSRPTKSNCWMALASHKGSSMWRGFISFSNSICISGSFSVWSRRSGTPLSGINRIHTLTEKTHNRLKMSEFLLLCILWCLNTLQDAKQFSMLGMRSAPAGFSWGTAASVSPHSAMPAANRVRRHYEALCQDSSATIQPKARPRLTDDRSSNGDP